MLDIELLTQNKFLRKRCSEPTNVAHCPECGSEFIHGKDGKISCPACLTTNPKGAFYCTRCHHETGGAGERHCSSIAAYEQCKSLNRPAFAPHEPLWQVLTSPDSVSQILEESKVRIYIAAARFPAGTKIRGESDVTDLLIEDVPTFQADLRHAPTPEEARLSGADYMPSFGNWMPFNVGRPAFYEELMNEVASIPSLEKLSSHLKEPPITSVENEFPQIPPGMNPYLYTLVVNFSIIRKPMPDLMNIFLGEFHWKKGDLSKAWSATSRVFMEDMSLRTKVWLKNMFLRLRFNHTQLVQAEETVRVFHEQVHALQKRLEIVRVTEQAASAHDHIADAELLLHTIEMQKSKDKLKNIFQRLVSQAQQMKFAFIENWYAEQLQTFPLNEAHFDQIGRQLKRQLQNHGIHSAADIEANVIDQLPGFGPARVNILMQWKQECKDIVAHRPVPALPNTNTDATLANQMQEGLLAAIDLKKKHLACKYYVQSMNVKI
ncbi:MAG: helix-hairpin-helix domain-containing protein, partial [Opitutaceae bacterium]